MSQTIKAKIVEQLETLPENLQWQVLEYTQGLHKHARRGVDGKKMIKFAGTIPSDDLAIIEEAIKSGCEQVDANEW